MSKNNPSEETRQLVHMRDEWRCIRCGSSMYNNYFGEDQHHRRMRSHKFPGLHAADNIIDLCGSGTTGCHGYVHQHPTESYENGWLVHSYEDPAEVPINIRGLWYLLKKDGTKVPYEGKLKD